MYSNKDNVNILVGLLAKHGVRHAVVCPGSRNAPIANDLHQCPLVECHPVTDERSAGFYALGLALATDSPVAVCVTSGSAVLNVAPAVAEAYYRQVPMVVVSADRPSRWIGQLDGQTLPQPGVFGTLVRRCVSLPEGDGEQTTWHCTRLINEALLTMMAPAPGPVHINVPIDEPLFGFSRQTPVGARAIRRHSFKRTGVGKVVAQWMAEADRPMVVIGECHHSHEANHDLVGKALGWLDAQGVLLCEGLCTLTSRPVNVDEAVALLADTPEAKPDLVVYLGATVVSKRLRRYLRSLGDTRVVMATTDDTVCDVTTHLTDLVEADDTASLLADIAVAATALPPRMPSHFHLLWHEAFEFVRQFAEEYTPPFSQMAVVRYFERQLDDMELDFDVHYANSSAVRLGNLFAEHSFLCNRGVNGIEGSLSTAAGYAAACPEEHLVFCVIGDLSFFYDQNALWNTNLKGNLRILLLNNGGGGIFRQLDGLDGSEARGPLVAAEHHTSAAGACQQHDVGYLRADNFQEAQFGVVSLLTRPAKRPMLLEVVTDAASDTIAVKEFYKQLYTSWQKENGRKSGTSRN